VQLQVNAQRHIASGQAAKWKAQRRRAAGIPTRAELAARAAEKITARPRLHDAHVRQWRADPGRMWAWRYHHDPAFNVKERARTELRKMNKSAVIAKCINSAFRNGGDSPSSRSRPWLYDCSTAHAP
jgi:hypothetical protein